MVLRGREADTLSGRHGAEMKKKTYISWFSVFITLPIDQLELNLLMSVRCKNVFVF